MSLNSTDSLFFFVLGSNFSVFHQVKFMSLCRLLVVEM